MSNTNFIQIHPKDNVLVALQNLPKGYRIEFNGSAFFLPRGVAAKHKFTCRALDKDSEVVMYGVLVGRLNRDVLAGELLDTQNLRHDTEPYVLGARDLEWTKPDVSAFVNRRFLGYHRSDGRVGTANYWLVIPMVFCENRNVSTLKEALEEKLGYRVRKKDYSQQVDQLIAAVEGGDSSSRIRTMEFHPESLPDKHQRLFENVDGIKFLNHDMGCGGTRQDSDALCGLLAGYITHPNVAGATVLSLGCQHAQVSILKEEIRKREPGYNRPLYVFEQQEQGTEQALMHNVLRSTFAGLIEANRITRRPAGLDKLCVGLECGGSDGFSGISANPVLGWVSDMLVTLGGSVMLSEFPELCGVEQELSDRCVDVETAQRFLDLMQRYNTKAEADGSGFYMNPSPGNIRDGLITDAIKSAGAAKKGGTSPVQFVADYPELANKQGLNLLCTPGNDVESTTAEVGAGATIVLFTTGLGTPTGNPIAPVIKVASNTAVYHRMNDAIDINCGTVIEGVETIEQAAHRTLEYLIEIASGQREAKAVQLGQDDFIPWRRGVSL
ncbi:MAG TPA: altronate dehydratase family protein [Candidatus Sphingobacterium stercorigallinarum]|nr:altronate dehydratase family protein [Candidatus Sphingobacterium stercorigallinarum]